MATVELHATTKHFLGRERPVVDAVSLRIDQGEFIVLLGPSGCGKTTLLRMIAGLEDPDSGDTLIDGASVLNRKPRERDFALVLISDGHVCRSEVETLQRLQIEPQLGLAPGGFSQVVSRPRKPRPLWRMLVGSLALGSSTKLGRSEYAR